MVFYKGHRFPRSVGAICSTENRLRKFAVFFMILIRPSVPPKRRGDMLHGKPLTKVCGFFYDIDQVIGSPEASGRYAPHPKPQLSINYRVEVFNFNYSTFIVLSDLYFTNSLQFNFELFKKIKILMICV